METPTEITRNTHRTVLAEIPMKSVFLTPTDPWQNVNRNSQYDINLNAINSFQVYQGDVLVLKQPVNPAEFVIKQRGLRKIPVFSPDIDDIKQNNKSEELDFDSDINSILAIDATRKRLLYDDDPLDISSQQTDDSSPPDPKKLCVESEIELPDVNCLPSALKALSHNQLISLIWKITSEHPDIEQEIRSNFPDADLKPLENRLNDLVRNIYKALPRDRLIPKRSAIAYHRASLHIQDFKKCVIDEGQLKIESKQWKVVLEFVFVAWKYVCKTPKWEVSVHNSTRKECFKFLSLMCYMALKEMKDALTDDQCKTYESRLRSLLDHEEVEDLESCLQLLAK